jgi:hypothetical protein
MLANQPLANPSRSRAFACAIRLSTVANAGDLADANAMRISCSLLAFWLVAPVSPRRRIRVDDRDLGEGQVVA